MSDWKPIIVQGSGSGIGPYLFICIIYSMGMGL